MTDNYPGETSWTLHLGLDTVIGTGGPYDTTGSLHEQELALFDGEYTFMIMDDAGDGICCGYGYGEWKLLLNGEVVERGDPSFGSSASYYFTLPLAPSPPISPPSPPMPPAIPPLPAADAVLTIIFDRYPSETTWTIEHASSGVVASGGPYNSSYYEATLAIPLLLNEGSYTFTVTDSAGDGSVKS